MKFVLTPSTYHPVRGGAELHCQNVAEELARRGHAVEVITSDLATSDGYGNFDGGSLGSGVTGMIGGVKVTRVPYYSPAEAALAKRTVAFVGAGPLHKLLFLAFKAIFRLRFNRALRREIILAQPDVIIAMPHLRPNVRVAIAVARQARIRCVMLPLLHSHDPDWPTAAMKRALAKVDAIVTSTRHEADELKSSYAVDAGKIFVCGVGVSVDNVQPVDFIRTGLPRTVLFLGRKTRSKGLANFADAIGVLAQERNDFQVVVVGAKAGDTDQILSEFYSKVPSDIFVNRDDVSDAERDRWLRDCSMLVLPSPIESFGLVLLEAWAAGKPVITLDLPVFKEIVSPGIDGLLVPVDDPKQLAAAMAQLIDKPDLCGKMGRAGYDKVLLHHQWTHVVDRMEGAWR